MRSPRSRFWAIVIAAVAVAGALIGWEWRASEARAAAESASAQSGANVAGGGLADPSRAGSNLPAAARPLTREQQLALWQQRYMRAANVYSGYRDATRYPPQSRPLEEHPDQMQPFTPITEELPLRDAAGKPAKGLRIRTTQERVFLSGAESARFTIAATDESGRPLAIVINRSQAQTIPDTRALVTLVHADVPFADNGASPDDAAGDGTYSARLAPAIQGFGNHSGTVRLLVELTADGQKGVVPFDIVYVPEVPATWSGVREAMEDGGLNFYLKAQVKTPGRYVASARVYDANNAPVALLQFNETVAAGAAEFKLSLAGVLVRDKNPAFPLRLVDIEGFLLKPDTFPDRAMMARQPGETYVSQRYNVASFSGDEWQSEERARYLAEYNRDVQQALNEVERLRR
jgi:hypothetical protein